MGIGRNKNVLHLHVSRGPGETPALCIFAGAFLVFSFIVTEAVFPLDFNSFQPYTAPTGGNDAQTGGKRDHQFDAKRAVERFQAQDQKRKETFKREEEKKRDSVQIQEIEQHVGQEKKISGEIAQQEKREADFIYGRTTGLDSFSMGKDGSVWRSHLALLAEAWNVLSKDLYGNGSRSHLTQFSHNDLLNVTGMRRKTVDPAGRVTETGISEITYMPGEALLNYLGENKEAARTEVTTTFYPTGNQVTRSKSFDLVYEGGRDGKVIAQKVEITDLSGPATPLLQEIFNMKYDGDNVVHSQAKVTDLGTGTVTESVTDNHFGDGRLISGLTESTIKDPINHSLTRQTATQKVSYNGGGVADVDAKTLSTTRPVDEAGNVFEDYVTTVETTQVMDVFFGIPNPTEIVSVSHTIDNVSVQTTESKQFQKFTRDLHGNALGATGTESATTVNSDRSIIQNTESTLDFLVRADQPYLIGRDDRGIVKDFVNEQDITTNSRLQIRLGVLGEVLEGTRIGTSHTANHLGTIVTDSEFTEQYDRAAKANALGLIRRETTSHSVNSFLKENIATTTEKRVTTQSHDDTNRVLGASETMESLTTDTFGSEIRVEGTVAYDVGRRTNQAYAVSSRNQITSKDPASRLYTESTQTNTFESDAATGRAIRGRGITESFARRLLDDGTILDTFSIRGTTEEALEGLTQANGFGMTTRIGRTEVRDVANHQVTDRQEVLTQSFNDVGKVMHADGFTYSTTQDLGRTGVYQTKSLTQTNYRLIGNSPIPIENKTVEMTVNHVNSSYRVVVRHDVTRHDKTGRILPIDEKRPEKSGHQILVYEDNAVQTIPNRVPTVEQLFQQHFAGGRP